MADEQGTRPPAPPLQIATRRPLLGGQTRVAASTGTSGLHHRRYLEQHLIAIDQHRAAVRARHTIAERIAGDLEVMLAHVQARLATAQARARAFAEQEALLVEQRRIVECQLEEVQAAVVAHELP